MWGCLMCLVSIPHLTSSFPSSTFVQPLPYLWGLELRSPVALQFVPQTQQCVGHLTKEDKGLVGIKWGIWNSKINVEEENSFSFKIQVLWHWETLNDAREREMRIKLIIGWITEEKDRKQRRTLCWTETNLSVEHPCTFISIYYV